MLSSTKNEVLGRWVGPGIYGYNLPKAGNYMVSWEAKVGVNKFRNMSAEIIVAKGGYTIYDLKDKIFSQLDIVVNIGREGDVLKVVKL